MPCKRPVIFPKVSDVVPLPCGQCRDCRIMRRAVETHRNLLERKLHRHATFLTLTSDDKLHKTFADPVINSVTGQVFRGPSVDPTTFKRFIDKLRINWRRATAGNFRYTGVGEYGGKFGRPHYHGLIYGIPNCPHIGTQSPDQNSRCKCPLCSLVRRTWANGNVELNVYNDRTANYVCGYNMDKLADITDKHAEKKLDGRHPQFRRASNRPGIGRDYIRLLAHELTKTETIKHWTDVPKILFHGPKARPLGHYLYQKLLEDMGFWLEPGEALEYYEKELRELLNDFNATSEVAYAAQYRLDTALTIKNRQHNIDLEAKDKLYGQTYDDPTKKPPKPKELK
ncbi:replication initiator protein [Microviridae sp.]|nr:replication initiator protein [Microviridae sp.]